MVSSKWEYVGFPIDQNSRSQAAVPATDDIYLLLTLQEGLEKVKSSSMRQYYTLFWWASILLYKQVSKANFNPILIPLDV